MIVKSPWPNVMPVPEMPVYKLIEETAQRLPDKTSMVFIDGRQYTFSELANFIDKFAKALKNLGVKKVDVIAIDMPNAPEYVIAFHGILKAGGIVTTLNPLYTEREINYQFNDANVKLAVTIEPLLPLIEAVKNTSPLENIIVVGLSKEKEGVYDFWKLVKEAPDINLDVSFNVKEDLAVLPYSSGTTGLPKGVMLTHYNLVVNVKQTIGTGEIEEKDVVLAFLPFFHIYGLTVLMNVVLAAGSTIVIMPKFEMEQFLSLMEKHKVTKTYIAPPVALGMTLYPDLKKYDLSSLISITSAAAPLPIEVGRRLQELLPHVIVKQGYGMTEASPVVAINPLDKEKVKLESVGWAIPDTELKIVALDDPSKTLPIGEVGELAIRGPQIMKGYLNREEETKEVLTEDGWYLSGDIAKLDEEGYLYILDRKKEMIKYKGYQIAPAELESLIMSHPDVADAAVIPKPDPEAGEIPKAFVVLKPGAKVSAEELMEFVAKNVAPYKKIREIEFVSEIPKSATGKILRRVLIEEERKKASQ